MTSKLPALVLALVALPVSGQQKPAYTDAEAAKHVGEEATVTGKVITVSTSGKGTTFLNFGDRFPRHTFGGVIFSRNQDAVGDVKQYEGKEVSLTGRIELSPTDQKPQIVITRADQLKPATAANSPAPATPAPAAPAPTPAVAAPAPAATAPMVATAKPTAPAPTVPETPASESSSGKSLGKIQLPLGWNSPRRGGDMVRKDLARLFGDVGSASENNLIDTSLEVYPGVPFLATLATAKKTLNLENAPFSKTKISTAGFPQDAFSAHEVGGVFPGGYDRLSLITDSDDQVVSVLLVDSSSRTRVANETDTTGYHTYNFISGGGKAASYLNIRHEVTPPSTPGGVLVVDTLLIDPTDPESPTASRSSKGSKSGVFSYTRQRTGKVLERSRWFVPVPVANLILRCVGG